MIVTSAEFPLQRASPAPDGWCDEAVDLALALPARALDELRIGRGQDNHVVLSDPSVSRLHAVVKGAPGRWTVVDCGSRNGTWVGEARLQPAVPHRLRDGDTLRVGRVALPVQAEVDGPTEDDTTTTLDPACEPVSLSHYQLQVVRLLCAPWRDGDGEPATNVEIAAQLGTPQAVDAVKAALRRAYARAGLTDAPPSTKRRQLCRVARDHGWA